MDNIKKVFSLLLIAILAFSSLMAVKFEHVSAQVTTPHPQVTPSSNPPSPTPSPPTPTPAATPVYPKPIVPEFTVELASKDENKTVIQLTIKNQPFNRDNPHHYSLVYNVRIKTSTENWTDLYNPEDGYPTQSNTTYTVLTFVAGENAYYPSSDYPLSPSMKVGILPTSGQVDFQVQAMIGYRDRGVFSEGIMPYVFKGEKSDWSNTQTLSLNEVSASPMPPAPEFAFTLVLSLFVVAVLLIATISLLKKRFS